jgi:hypothetical protein
MTLASFVQRVIRTRGLVGLAAITVVSVAIAATAGFPFTEDFTSTNLSDPSTTADWDTTSPGTLRLALATELSALTLNRSQLGGPAEVPRTSRDIVLGDIDRDGDLDAVVGNEGPGASGVGAPNLIYFNDGGFDTAPTTLGSDSRRTRGLAIGDLDRDGDLDIVAGNFQQEAVYYLNDGSGNFSSGTVISPFAGNTWRVKLLDVDGDTDLDMIEIMSGSQNFLYKNRLMENRGVLSWASPVAITNESFASRSVAVGDIDSDGDLDFIAGDQGVGNHIYRWFPSGIEGRFFARGVVHNNTNLTFAVELADLNGDGFLDLVEGNLGAPTQIYFNKGAGINVGEFNNPVPLADSNAAHTTVALLLRDLDRDGDIDIVEGNNGAWDDDNDDQTPRIPMPVRFYLNNGNGTFANAVEFFPAEVQKVYGIAGGDVNNDGQLDFVTAHSSNNSGGPEALATNALYTNAGIPGGALVRQLDGFAQSLEVDGGNNPISTANLTLTKAQAAELADLDFFLSNDGGFNYLPVEPNVPVRFPISNGNRLFWKVNMLTGSPNSSQLAEIIELRIAANNTPIFTNIGQLNEIEGQPVSGTANLAGYFNDPDGHALTYQMSGLPNGTGIQLDAQTGQLSGVLTNADAQASPISLLATAYDGAESRTGTVILNVAEAVNDPPTAVDDGPFAIDEGGAIAGTINVLGNDTDPESEVLTAVLVDAPTNSAVFELRPDGTFDYTHDGSETAEDSFTYRAADAANQSNVATVSLTINPVNDVPVITLIGASVVNVVVGGSFTDLGAEALDAEDGEISANIVVGGEAVDTGTAGTYVITYDVTDSDGAPAAQVTRTVNVTTDNVPVITLNGDATVFIGVGGSYTDAGASAQDVEDGDITADIVVGGDTVDTGTIGTYVITYNVTDASGNAATEVTRTVNVVADAPPVITLVGPAIVNLTVGDAYTDQGATAEDTEDGDISADIVVGGDTVNTGTAGTYVITYNVMDSGGNAATEVTRTVIVSNPPPPPPPPPSGGGGGITGIWEIVGLMFAGLAGLRRKRAGKILG